MADRFHYLGSFLALSILMLSACGGSRPQASDRSAPAEEDQSDGGAEPASERPAYCLPDKLFVGDAWFDQAVFGEPVATNEPLVVDVAIISSSADGRAPSTFPVDAERAAVLAAGPDFTEIMKSAPSGDGPDLVLAINNVAGVFPGPAFDVSQDGRIHAWTNCETIWQDSTEALLEWTGGANAEEVLAEIRSFTEITRETDAGYDERGQRVSDLATIMEQIDQGSATEPPEDAQ